MNFEVKVICISSVAVDHYSKFPEWVGQAYSLFIFSFLSATLSVIRRTGSIFQAALREKRRNLTKQNGNLTKQNGNLTKRNGNLTKRNGN